MYVSRDRGLSIDPLYIEDPFDFENNVGSTCFRIQQIVKAFADAYASLEKELFEGPLDGTKAGESFTLLQKILPSMAGKWGSPRRERELLCISLAVATHN
jgi:DNA polymerase sigma